MSTAPAHAKLNLALVVGDRRTDGKHEVATILQRIDVADRIELEAGPGLRIEGFTADTLVRSALEALASRAQVDPGWHARITKEIPVAAGLGGGSSDAAVALELANATLARPLPREELAEIGAAIGADVPFFLTEGPQLGTGDGSVLEPVDLPQDYLILVVLPHGEAKQSTAFVYDRFDVEGDPSGFERRRRDLLGALARRDLAALPPNDLARSPLAEELRGAGAFRADVTGAGPAVYGLFRDAAHAERAEVSMRPRGRTWITKPAW